MAVSDSGLRAAVLLLSIASFFSGAALRICDGLLPRLAADFSVTAGTAGEVILAFAMAYGFSQLAYGQLGDRYGKARVVCIALFASAAGAFACLFAPSLDALVRLRVLWGAVAGGVIPMSMAWIGDNVPWEQRQATLARLLLGTLSGMTAGQLAGGLFADSAWGWRGAFGALCIGYLVVATLLLARLHSIPSHPASHAPAANFLAPMREILRMPWPRVVLLAVLAEGVFLLGPLAYLPAYLHQRFGLALSVASGYVALYAIGGVLYARVAQHIVRRFGERRMVGWGGLVVGLGFLAWYLIPYGWIAAPVALLVGFGTYLYHNTLQTHGTQMAPARRGTGMSLFAFAFFSGQAIGVALAGRAFDRFGAAPVLLVPALALPLAGWAFARALKHRAAA
ncbi:MAG TPA: MFS transporter [Ramlibacter sp.]|uniref:MFS transporter n=1 Tax=Ramlibacter sp. TaxID=1917967 RepID=UPI002D7F3482|nr:MFS transporter [Ramlibacter sp.]HET8748667.1 MFS transporter [Ramlibacter sp.]